MNSLFHTVKRDEEDKIKRLGLGNMIFLLNYLGLVSLVNDYNLIFEHKKLDENKNSSIFLCSNSRR